MTRRVSQPVRLENPLSLTGSTLTRWSTPVSLVYNDGRSNARAVVTKTTTLIGATVGVALLAAYVVLTVANHDGSPILYVLVGWLGGAGTPAVTAAVKKTNGP